MYIPQAVYEELISDDRFKEEAQQIMNAAYVKKVIVEDQKSVYLLQRVTGLDAGESEAIILCDEIKADLLLMDEVSGRKVAKQMELNIMGTIGVLMVSFEENILSAKQIEESIEVLQKNGRHISEKLYKKLRDKIRESK